MPKKNQISWPWFIVGCVLLLAALVAFFWGFALGNLTFSQWSLLTWLLPLGSGFACGCFSGSVKLSGTIGNLVIAATGGFAVWLLTHYFLPKPISTSFGQSSITTNSNIGNVAVNQGIVNNGQIQLINNYYQIITNVTVTTNLIMVDPFLLKWHQGFQNQIAYSHQSFITATSSGDYSKAFDGSLLLIKMLESAPPNVLGDFTSHQKSALYGLVALCADMTDTNAEIAYEYAVKAYEFETNQMTHSTLAVTSHNLANRLAQKGEYTNALELNSKALADYESDPKYIENSLPTNAIFHWYATSAKLTTQLGMHKESQFFWYKAASMNPSSDNINGLLVALKNADPDKTNYYVGIKTNPFVIWLISKNQSPLSNTILFDGKSFTQ